MPAIANWLGLPADLSRRIRFLQFRARLEENFRHLPTPCDDGLMLQVVLPVNPKKRYVLYVIQDHTDSHGFEDTSSACSLDTRRKNSWRHGQLHHETWNWGWRETPCRRANGRLTWQLPPGQQPRWTTANQRLASEENEG